MQGVRIYCQAQLARVSWNRRGGGSRFAPELGDAPMKFGAGMRLVLSDFIAETPESNRKRQGHCQKARRKMPLGAGANGAVTLRICDCYGNVI